MGDSYVTLSPMEQHGSLCPAGRNGRPEGPSATQELAGGKLSHSLLGPGGNGGGIGVSGNIRTQQGGLLPNHIPLEENGHFLPGDILLRPEGPVLIPPGDAVLIRPKGRVGIVRPLGHIPER